MTSIRWFSAFILALALVYAPVTAALAVPAPVPSAGGGWRCTTTASSGTCGPYSYSPISNSNGYTTYVGNNMWACGSPGQCGRQTLQVNSPGDWQVTSNQAAGNTAVLTYPDVQQLFSNARGGNPRLSSFTTIRSRFTESMPHNAATDAEAAYDLWTSSAEVMLWVDNANRGTGGATVITHHRFARQRWTLMHYGSELIWSKNRNEQSGTVHILAMLRWLQSHRYIAAAATLGQVDFGWEICSTGKRAETFKVRAYTLRSA